MVEKKSNLSVKVETISVVSAVEGFRRSGYKFGKEPVTLRVAELSLERIGNIKNDPMLTVIYGAE